MVIQSLLELEERKENLAARIAAAKQQLAERNSPMNNQLLLNLYVASSTEMYIAYFKGMQAAIEHWGVAAPMEIPKDLPAYYVVCPVCGNTCGTLFRVKQHKLLDIPCAECEEIFQHSEPLIGGYAIQELAKHMNQTQEAIEHFICEAMMMRRRIKLNGSC